MSKIFVDKFAGVLPDDGILVKIYCKEMQKGTEKRLEIESALKLQELVKERIKVLNQIKEGSLVDKLNNTTIIKNVLHYLVEESEK